MFATVLWTLLLLSILPALLLTYAVFAWFAGQTTEPTKSAGCRPDKQMTDLEVRLVAASNAFHEGTRDGNL